MAWEEIDIEELSSSLGVNHRAVREKQHLVKLIIKTRKLKKLSQQNFAKKIGVTQGRLAQIESGIGTTNVTFDVLLNILRILGYDFKSIPKKVA